MRCRPELLRQVVAKQFRLVLKSSGWMTQETTQALNNARYHITDRIAQLAILPWPRVVPARNQIIRLLYLRHCEKTRVARPSALLPCCLSFLWIQSSGGPERAKAELGLLQCWEIGDQPMDLESATGKRQAAEQELEEEDDEKGKAATEKNLEGLCWMVGRLLLRHEDQFGIQRSENNFIMFFKRESQMTRSTSRAFLFRTLLDEFLKRLQAVSDLLPACGTALRSNLKPKRQVVIGHAMEDIRIYFTEVTSNK
ncbi:hypothetical protein AK812_SmicGene4371 [Symbiodinium microadriaticum]|uniref:Uncharacterized protein n=1 Tax=Symbiodinium microadriaticum TaxID=2951 RepID=A0A1Q9EWI1_SYMMI|nr:hypothetical protein AK812_SmicGene4371 [Symbiodinium microadriaticum]CAE7390812.1 unnamed protein product [Symbiodinium microadriaticum]CAE7947108.1 unnamed protein product [Symbiodinium sp. KB8]